MKILPFYTFGGKGEKLRRTFIFLIFSENEAGGEPRFGVFRFL